ncbi:Uncharacterised protein [Nocardia otitidiscaviarum]|uniref:ABC transporter ATP-binding protein n=1 Tax=Nocardia otitidiscaviarum TaxID=1823 RepID=A0A378YRI0_9NOCA|nr:hypothetical protein [Nocardia otitidiscaviarum]MBF6240851.1 hypothetical protein [Nocardia otitidiscaviarum]SUA79805.1 Uncharacterised protein [Nocardia otitidiscaviarum]
MLAAIDAYPGAIVMVTHDEGTIDALRPDRVLLLPAASEDLWIDEYRAPCGTCPWLSSIGPPGTV